ncbi:hypothetical protein K474DRAFT_448156 [Panus rudis PR-1116 ss-1]|nr:hypothetical protein K474DRAFT_448156 [Panus rudis PR-1116 ss-1]
MLYSPTTTTSSLSTSQHDMHPNTDSADSSLIGPGPSAVSVAISEWSQYSNWHAAYKVPPMKCPWTHLRIHSRHWISGDALDLAFYVDDEEASFHAHHDYAYGYIMSAPEKRYHDYSTLKPVTPSTPLDHRPPSLTEALSQIKSLSLQLHGWNEQTSLYEERISAPQVTKISYYDNPWMVSDVTNALCMLDTFQEEFEVDYNAHTIYGCTEAKKLILSFYYFGVSPLFTSVKTLPIELCELIIEYGTRYERMIFNIESQSFLANCCLVCKAWATKSQYLLYQNITLRELQQGTSLMRTLFKNSHLCALVKKLELYDYPDVNVTSLLLLLSGKLPSLTNLSLTIHSLSLMHSDLFYMKLDFPRLQYLYLWLADTGNQNTNSQHIKELYQTFSNINNLTFTVKSAVPSYRKAIIGPWRVKASILKKLDFDIHWECSWFLYGLVQQCSINTLQSVHLNHVDLYNQKIVSHINKLLLNCGLSLQKLSLQITSAHDMNGILHILDFKHSTALQSILWHTTTISHKYGINSALPSITRHITSLPSSISTIYGVNQICEQMIYFHPYSVEELLIIEAEFSPIAVYMFSSVKIILSWKVEIQNWKSYMPVLVSKNMIVSQLIEF